LPAALTYVLQEVTMRKSKAPATGNPDLDDGKISRRSSRREVMATLLVGATSGAVMQPGAAAARRWGSMPLPTPGTGLLVMMYDRLFFVPSAWLSYFEITNQQPDIQEVKRRMRRRDRRNIQRVMYGNLGDPNLPHPNVPQGAQPVVVPPAPDETYLAEMISPDMIDSA
jgi:hypothetical protein